MDTDADDLPAHVHLLYGQKIDENDLKSEVARNLKQLTRTHTDTFAKSTDDLGFCSLLEHDVDTGDARPIKQSPRLTVRLVPEITNSELAVLQAEDESLGPVIEWIKTDSDPRTENLLDLVGTIEWPGLNVPATR